MVDFSWLTNWQTILFFGMVTVFVISGGITAFVIMNKRMWPFSYVVLENVSGFGNIPTKRGKCKLIGFGDGGEEIFFLKGTKKWRAAYGKRIGANQIAWSIGEDGYWYNTTFGNLDRKLREIGVLPVDRDMRYAYASIRKGIENRYNEKNFFEKWSVPITIGMLVIAIVVGGISFYHGQKKINEGIQLTTENNQITKQILDQQERILSNIDNIANGGAGIAPV